jgi:2-keto-4-pentenoate hydratase
MTTERVKQAARHLVDAYRSKTQIARLPADCQPQTAEEAYAVQDAVALLRGPVKGWKISPSTPHRCASVFVVEPSGATLETASLPGCGAEVEFGFRVARDLPARATPYSAEEVFAAIEFIPLMEVIASRFADKRSPTPMELLADGMTHGAYVIGKPIADWRNFDFRKHAVSMSINGKQVQQTEGWKGKIEPPDGVVWLANHVMTRAAGGLKAGIAITTGALAGTTPAQPGDKVVGDWGDWGRVETTFR